jgi:nitrite reductase (NO-forming)
VIFNVTDVGVATHDFEICTAPKIGLGYPNLCVGTTTKQLAPTESGTISVTLKKGIYEYLCTVPGHANAGMKGVLIVT